MEFIKDSVPRFYASVGADRVALPCGTTVVASGSPIQRSETAGSAQLSYELWHCRFGHISLSRLKSLVEDDLVSNLSLPKLPASTPVCPACLEGKQT